MKKPVLIGRNDEWAQLEDCMQSPRSEFVTVCGRRRIGKTFLVDRFFDGVYDFSFTGGHKLSTKQQLRNFGKALKQYAGEKQPALNDWFDAFDALEEYLAKLPDDRKKVIFIDEMPWIDTQRSDFVEALENFWNGWANRRYDIVLVASGSATSWMADNLFENQGGLHNRITTRLDLKPFSIKETEEYLESMNFKWDRYQILQCYMFTGGVPFYLSLMRPRYSAAQNIDRLFFNDKAPLRNEFDELYNALFSHAESYIKIVEILYGHKEGLARQEIACRAKFNGTYLNTILKNLEQCSFIAKRTVYGDKEKSLYRLTDHFTLFYFKFREHLAEGSEEWWCSHLDDDGVESWEGLAFELVCLQHRRQIKKALEIGAVNTSFYTWKCKSDENLGTPGAQVDMVIERADRIVHLCEIKFSRGEFIIKKDYEARLRQRMSIFRQLTGTKYAIHNTFLTTYGVLDGKYKSIVDEELLMDALFIC